MTLVARVATRVSIKARVPYCKKLVPGVGYYRLFHESPNKLNGTFGVNIPHDQAGRSSSSTTSGIANVGIDHESFKIPDSTTYLKDFKVSELLSYGVIGAATLNKPILNMCIKMFPYVPMSVIKALVYKLYCGGENIEEVKQTGMRLSKRGINNMMLSLTIEACNGNDNIDPEFIVSETQRSVTEILIPHILTMIKESGKDINSIPPGYVALKPTGFAKDATNVLKYYKTDPHYAAMFEELVDKASNVCGTIYEENLKLSQKFPDRTAPFIVGVIDAEKHELQEGVYELQRRLYAKYNPLNKPISIVGTLQMYLSGSSDLLALEEKLAMENNYRLGLKLVRGAYIHSEKNREVIHKTKEDTDLNYNQGITYCIESILANKENELTIGHLVVASHNADSLKLTTEKLNRSSLVDNKNKNNVILGQLLGMADNITHNLIKTHNVDNVIKYVAWGPPLETKEYLLRRLEENGDAVRADSGFNLIKGVVGVLFKRLLRLV